MRLRSTGFSLTQKRRNPHLLYGWGSVLPVRNDPGGSRTRDLRINLPLRLSSPLHCGSVRGLDCPFAFTRGGQARAIQSLRLPTNAVGLVRGWDVKPFPDFDAIHAQPFGGGAPI
jgi:hypothetical protein